MLRFHPFERVRLARRRAGGGNGSEWSSDVSTGSQTLIYDNLNRVASASASGSYGSQSYTYDGVGNRLTRVLGSTTESYAYSSTANRVAAMTTSSYTRTFSYLVSGQVSQDVRDPADTYTFTLNKDGRNASASLNSATAGAYLYNAFEQRARRRPTRP